VSAKTGEFQTTKETNTMTIRSVQDRDEKQATLLDQSAPRSRISIEGTGGDVCDLAQWKMHGIEDVILLKPK
jgi:hypothetical protein